MSINDQYVQLVILISLSSSLGTAVEEGVALFADRHRLPYRPNTATARAHEVAAPEPPNHGSDSAIAGGYGVAEQSVPAAGTGVSAAGLAASRLATLPRSRGLPEPTVGRPDGPRCQPPIQVRAAVGHARAELDERRPTTIAPPMRES